MPSDGVAGANQNTGLGTGVFQAHSHKKGEPRCRGSPALSVDGLVAIRQPVTTHRLRRAADHRSAQTE